MSSKKTMATSSKADDEADKKLHEDLEQRIQRFGKTNPIELTSVRVNKIDTIKMLSEFETFAKKCTSGNLLMCNRQEVCKCKNKDKCGCDDDTYTEIRLIKSDILSNCKYMMEFQVQDPSALAKNAKLFRIFVLEDDGKERPIADVFIKRREFRLLIASPITFTLHEKPTLKYGVLTLYMDYLDFVT